MNKYDSIKLGDTAEIKHVITNEDLSKFVDLTGDDNRLHVDKNYAKNTSFKKQVVHGMLGASFISTIIGTKLPGDGALWYSQSLEFLLPVRIGDIITVKAEVIKKNDRNRSVELITDIYNQNNKKVTAGISKVKIIEQLNDNSLKVENSENLFFSIYPNPAKTEITISCHFESSVSLKVNLYSVFGTLLKSASIINDNTTLNITEIPNGLYILKIYNSNSEIGIQKLLIQH